MKSTSTKTMVSYEEALEIILGRVSSSSLEPESVPLDQCLRRVLAGAVKAPIDLPLFNNSAVDGYGVLVEDIAMASQANPVKLKLSGEIAAGNHDSLPEVKPGHCLRILTGAQTPPTAEAVVMKEFCTVTTTGPESNSDQANSSIEILVTRPARIGENIRLQGEEIECGATVLKAGTAITPPILGLIASLGLTEVAVCRSPKVAVVSTGDELKEPGQPLSAGEIYNSNSYALTAALNALGASNVSRRHCRDDRNATRDILSEALSTSDMIITAGGVSVGEYDHVKDVFEELGVETVFWKIAIKPGKPVYFGMYQNKPVFGLPGNPVSALVTFNLFVKPAIFKMLGMPHEPLKTYQARLARNLKKKAGRLDFVRGKLDCIDGKLEAMPVTGQESHMLSGLAQADCLLQFAQELEFLPEGESITVNPLNWYQ